MTKPSTVVSSALAPQLRVPSLPDETAVTDPAVTLMVQCFGMTPCSVVGISTSMVPVARRHRMLEHHGAYSGRGDRGWVSAPAVTVSPSMLRVVLA